MCIYIYTHILLKREGTKASLRKKRSIWSWGVNARAHGKRWET